MDLGATVCRPAPRCADCPLAASVRVARRRPPGARPGHRLGRRQHAPGAVRGQRPPGPRRRAAGPARRPPPGRRVRRPHRRRPRRRPPRRPHRRDRSTSPDIRVFRASECFVRVAPARNTRCANTRMGSAVAARSALGDREDDGDDDGADGEERDVERRRCARRAGTATRCSTASGEQPEEVDPQRGEPARAAAEPADRASLAGTRTCSAGRSGAAALRSLPACVPRRTSSARWRSVRPSPCGTSRSGRRG